MHYQQLIATSPIYSQKKYFSRKLLKQLFLPLLRDELAFTRKDDQLKIFLCCANALSSRQVIRIKKNHQQREIGFCTVKFTVRIINICSFGLSAYSLIACIRAGSFPTFSNTTECSSESQASGLPTSLASTCLCKENIRHSKFYERFSYNRQKKTIEEPIITVVERH